MLLMIDNYDSFTYILVQYFTSLGEKVIVRRNDEVTLNEIEALNPDAIIISPGPCSPNEAGISNDALLHFAGRLPILGVCLGMQCMAASFKGEVIRAPAVMHGKTSLINHNNQGVFKNLANPLRVARYHSLVINPDKIPENFEITAWINEDPHHQPVIMGIKHRELAIEGVQFHPESFLTEQGQELLGNFIRDYLDTKIHAKL